MSLLWSLKRAVRSRILWLGASLLVLALFWTSLFVFKFLYKRELLLREHKTSTRPAIKSGNPMGIRILFLGDSRASQWTTLPGDRYLTINAGGSGETTRQILQRTASLLTSEKPQFVVFQGGINDLKMIGVMPGKEQEIESRCFENIEKTVRLCRESGTLVVLTPIVPPGRISWVRRVVWPDQIGVSLGRINSALKEHYRHEAGVVVLDIERSLGLSNAEAQGINQGNYRDELHLSPEAYSKIQPDLIRSLDFLAGSQKNK